MKNKNAFADSFFKKEKVEVISETEGQSKVRCSSGKLSGWHFPWNVFAMSLKSLET